MQKHKGSEGKIGKYRIVFSGGGTGGSVSPLLAIAESLKTEKSEFELYWIGTRNGLEKEMVKKENIEFISIASGKLRRYFSFENFIDIIKIMFGFLQSLVKLLIIKPDILISAGAYVSVPVAWSAWILHIPVLIHQMDYSPGLANKLMSPVADRITVTFQKSIKDYGNRAIWTGNPLRKDFLDLAISTNEKYHSAANLPVVLILGGGTGAMPLNKLVWESLPNFSDFCKILHITGKDKTLKSGTLAVFKELNNSNYESYEFLSSKELAVAYAKASIVVSRCGMGVLTELSFLGKPSILIPIPGSHQEDNAKIFKENEAAIVLDQDKLDKMLFVENIRALLLDKKLCHKLSENIMEIFRPEANRNMMEVIKQILKIHD
jgi:UDP-N-acetylglucosamine--N-acetylmuramyl-(pentapeptide) pyrophosphoryl-undecaprenol N-acetylglucosamine transferase